ncbi:MAG: rod shape-determining protein MreC [Clostridia bacterium]|nr:rod shape-determining protein MreC [Clostridia bacterium]
MRFLKNKTLIATAVIIVLSMALISASNAGSLLAGTVGAAGGLVVPLQRALYQVSETAVGGVSSASPAGSAESGAMDYEELVAENARLRELLEFKESTVTQELKAAQIIGKEPGNWFEVFTIDLGANDGIEAGMPVVTPQGLVGRVEEVGLSWAKVMSIIDVRSSVSAIMERTRDTGVVKGTIGSDDLTATLSMNYLPLDTDIIEGDTVLTSGYDEVYPKGLIVGRVTSSTDQSGGKLVIVEPSVDFRRLEEVLVVISSQEETETAEDEDITAETVSSAVPGVIGDGMRSSGDGESASSEPSAPTGDEGE